MYDIYQNSKQYLSLNPYSTGSNSNPFPGWRGLRKFRSLNPYSTGSNSNKQDTVQPKDEKGLNPYSTGSNSNKRGILYSH